MSLFLLRDADMHSA